MQQALRPLAATTSNRKALLDGTPNGSKVNQDAPKYTPKTFNCVPLWTEKTLNGASRTHD